MFWICVWRAQCWVATSGLVGFWCVCVCARACFGKHKPWLYGYYESGAFFLIYVLPSLFYMLYLFMFCMATWQVSIWLSGCIISHLLWNTNSLSAGYLILFIAYLCVCVCVCVCARARGTLGLCFHNSQREIKYRNSGAGCSRNIKLGLYTGS